MKRISFEVEDDEEEMALQRAGELGDNVEVEDLD